MCELFCGWVFGCDKVRSRFDSACAEMAKPKKPKHADAEHGKTKKKPLIYSDSGFGFCETVFTSSFFAPFDTCPCHIILTA